ncbi:MAG: hypothetical protein JSU92_01970 [Deltaproteobacteria bacterium]|nr:MAG: hypothetical protein JSU92_01970 [Deltaproteobacteria bacterium]
MKIRSGRKLFSSEPILNILTATLKVQRKEVARSFLMFCGYFLVVATLILGRTTGDTLFLSRYDPSVLPYLYIGAALIVSIITLIYTRIAERWRRNISISIVSLFLILSIGAARALLGFNWGWFYPLLYIWVEVVGTLMLVQFWSLADDIFTTREAKRLFGIISAGGLLGNIICGFSIRVVIHQLGTENLLYLCAGAILLFIFLVNFVSRLPEVKTTQPTSPGTFSRKEQGEKGISRELRSSKYLQLIVVIVGLTYILGTIIDYQFKIIAGDFYQEESLAAFFGVYWACVGIISFFLQFFIAGRVLEKLGILFSLSILPGSLLFGSFFPLIIPAFGPVVALKFFDNTFRYTIHNVAVQLLYLPFSPELKGRVTAFLSGVVRPSAIGLSGALLVGFSLIFSATQMSYVSIILLLIWIFFTINIKQEYNNSLLHTLRTKKLNLEDHPLIAPDAVTLKVLKSALESEDENQVIYSLKALRDIGTERLYPDVSKLLYHRSPKVRLGVLEQLAQGGQKEHVSLIQNCLADPDINVRAQTIVSLSSLRGAEAIPQVVGCLNDPSPKIRAATITGLIKYGGIDGILLATEGLKQMLENKDPNVVVEGVRVLGEIDIKHFYQPLLKLLAEESETIQKEAIIAAGRMRNMKLIPPLLTKLGKRKTRSIAISSLANYGEYVLTILEETINDKKIDILIRRSIPRVLSQIGTQSALNVLMRSIEQDDSLLRYRIIKAIGTIRTRLPNAYLNPERVKEIIHKEIAQYYKTLRIALDLEGFSKVEILKTALEERLDELLEEIFVLLGFIYPPKTISVIFTNLRSTLSFERANATELMDNLLEREMKRLLLPILEDSSPSEKIKKGKSFYELPEKPSTVHLIDLLHSNSGWIRACTLYAIGENQMVELAEKIKPITEDDDYIVKEMAHDCLRKLRVYE